MVMWQLTEQVMSHMGVSNVMKEVIQDAVAAIHCSQCTPQPIPFFFLIVWQVRVCVLEVGDHD